MKKLDGKDLMIGDIVMGCIEQEIIGEAKWKLPCKVTEINHYGDISSECLHGFPDELDWQDGDEFSWIEPVLLTSEILEKNGFDKFITKHLDVWEEYVTTEAIDGDEDSIDRLYSISINVNKETNHISGNFHSYETQVEVFCPLNYVHQLQHALKICGIEKEIIL